MRESLLKKYSFFLILSPASNLLWLFWALPELHETGSSREMLQWLGIQFFVIGFLAVFIAANKKFIFWAVLAYGALTLLYALGVAGWALMGQTPLSVFFVAGLLFIMSFGLIYHALKDLKLGGKTYRSYYLED
jgi:hypothetical protein